uniref:Uncharacterized protein n=1 Tax=Tanacetum cinerariifolium TaxID=118510 RepID=A0A6L2KUG7_TANCI|nr:hypothetical protein [Tanacetum cinerariifolium]
MRESLVTDARYLFDKAGKRVDDLIACFNKAMTFLTAVASSRGNTISGQERVVKCSNCQGEGHMARKYTQPKRLRNTAWYKEKAKLAEAQEAGQILDEEQLAFLADPGIPAGQAHTIILHNSALQTKDLDTSDSGCDDLLTAQAVLMANISNYGSYVILEVPNSETYVNDIDNQIPRITTNANGTFTSTISGQVTAEEKARKKNDVKARSMLLMALPNEHILTFSQYKDAKTLFEAIQARFGDLYTMSIDDLYNNFKIVEQEIKRTVVSSSSLGYPNMAFLSSPSSTNEVDTISIQVSVASTPVSTKIHEDDLEEMDLKWQLSLLSMREKRYLQRTGKKITINGSDTAWYDKTKVECFNCHKMRHFARECRSPKSQESRPRNQDSSRKTMIVEDSSCKAMVAIDGAGNNGPMLLRPQHAGFGDLKLRFKIMSSKIVDHTFGDPQAALRDTGIFNSGCSWHMIGNKSFLLDYQEYDRGFIAFAGSSKGGKNWYRVSQTCDKKNSVLFTKIKCLILSPDFNLHDENQVLLKVPRKNNMYSFDLKNVDPSKGLTYLFAKATYDESNLWHMRLGHIKFKTMNKLVKGNLVRGLPSNIFENDHTCVACQKGKQHKASLVTDDYSKFSWVFFLAKKDKTSGILKDFITGIENQLNHKVKIIRCDNGTEFKNYKINQFCGIKRIKREFSNARIPQQNGVAERKNRTLIESRVLVTKPHNKIPYELLIGRALIISFMRPFGCPVTILNTLDHLGKFNGRNNEGFLVEWLFDIDSLTNSMNYQPVIAGNRTNVLNTSLDVPSSNEEVVSSPKDDAGKKSTVEPTCVEGSKIDDLGCLDQQMKSTDDSENTKSTNSFNTASPTVNTATALDDFSKIPNLEDTRIFDDAYDDIDEGAEADYNNLETVIPVIPIPSTRIYKDHPKEQIIEETLVDLPNEKRAIGTKWVYRNKRDQRGIIVRNKDRLVARRHRQEEGASLDRKSTTGGCQFLGSRLISWQCKKQIIVANSTTEAEYIATSSCCGQVLWLQNQLLDYEYNFMQTKIHVDNESVICVVKSPVYHSKTKHIEIRHHFNRDSYKKRLIEMVKIHTDSNVADLLTKAFDVTRRTQEATVLPQISVPQNLGADEAVNQEEGNKVERAFTTEASLEAAHDSDNIIKTQTTAMPNVDIP